VERTLDRSLIQGSLMKPFSLAELTDAIQRALADHAARTA
jgi:FixJ family two-component response regulator